MKDILGKIYDAVQNRPDLEEEEVTSLFENNGFFKELGYIGVPVDVRTEKHIAGGDRPDYFCKDKYGNIIFVVEFKKPSREDDLASHKGQLWDQYVVPLKADYGVLTDGEEMIVYERGGRNRPDRQFRRPLNDLHEEDYETLEALRKPTFEFDSMETVEGYFDEIDTVEIDQVIDGEDVGQNEFLDTFRLESGTLFYQTLERTFELLDYYLEEGEEDNFPRSAYEFWLEYYASDPGWYDIPKPWREIAGSASNKQKLMFCIETVQSLLGRLMLAKACEDNDFPNVNLSRFVAEETVDFRGEVEPVSYLLMGDRLMSQMRDELVESVFEQDIYYWWTKPSEEAAEKTPKEIRDAEWPDEVEQLGESFVEFLLAIRRFDFGGMSGDPLGELYQQYFDRETRRALGEFYTDPSLVSYIVDSTGYDGESHGRLIDPACGSGTFVVDALRRYKNAQGPDTDWEFALKDLCEKAKIVGIDIHPFAVVLSQIRFMTEILPEYREAIESDPGFVLKRLPIYRADSLVDETQVEEGKQQTLTASHGDDSIEFTMTLPVKDGSEFVPMTFELPEFQSIQRQTAHEVESRQDYFSGLLAVFDAVKDRASDDADSIETSELLPYFEPYFDRETNLEQVTSAFTECTTNFLETVNELRHEYDDGRLLKLVEDIVLSATLKNDLPYQYVVGNPPWVSKHSRYQGEEEERRLKQQYASAWNETDTYMQFMERGLDMLSKGGTLGFIVSNRYLTNAGSKEIRGLLAKNRIKEIVDFTDYQLFDGATTYSSIVTVEKRVENDDWDSFIDDNAFDDTYDIEAARVRDWDASTLELTDCLRRREPTTSVDFFHIDVDRLRGRVEIDNGAVVCESVSEEFKTETGGKTTVRAELPEVDVWPICSSREYGVIDRIEDAMDARLGDRKVVRDNQEERAENVVGNDIRVGIQTSGDGAYVVNPTVSVTPETLHELPTISVKPSGYDEQFTLETDLIKADITGEDVDRWLPHWNDRLVIVPYVQGDDRARLVRPTELRDEYELTWQYFTDPAILELLGEESKERSRLHATIAADLGVIDTPDAKTLDSNQYDELSDALRDNAEYLDTQNNDMWWYRYMYRKNIETLPDPKALVGNQAQRNRICFDPVGDMAPHNARVYGIALPDDKRHAVTGILNSNLIEFYHKQHARINQGKAYSFIEDYTSKWPVVLPEGDDRDAIEDAVEEILRLKELELKIERFPDPYIADARESGAEFHSFNYKASSKVTLSPGKQSDLQGEPAFEIDGEVVDSSVIDSDTKFEYVQEALEGTTLDKGETITVPVPLTDIVASDAVDAFEADKETLERKSIEQYEETIDDVVFSLYGVEDERDRELVERFNSQYKSIRSLPIYPE